MTTILKTSPIPPELQAEMEERAERAARGLVDPQARRAARARMERMREEFRRGHGEVTLAVELVREVRDGA